MLGKRHFARALLLGMALTGSFAGCLVVSPLEDVPEPSSPNSGGKTSQAGSSAAPAGEAGETGTGGHGASSSGCKTNADCVRPGAGAPYRCRPSDHACVPLFSDECPLVYGPADDPNAIFFGAFATLNPVAPDKSTILWSHELARKELNSDDVGGLPDGPGGERRPLVMIACNNAEGMVEPALRHLVQDVEVPAVLATLKPGDLRRGFEAHQARDIFYLSPVAVTETLVAEEDSDLIWNLLGQPSDLAPSYAELMRLSESYLRTTQSIAAAVPIRVALVTTTDAFDAELANAVRQVLVINDDDIAANDEAGNYLDRTMDQDTDLEALAIQIATFRPHVVVSTASDLFTKPGGLLYQLEMAWEDNNIPGFAMTRPFYLLSPYNAGDLSNVEDLINGQLDSLLDVKANERFVGLSIAGAEDSKLQNGYANRLRSRFPDAYNDSANYYDSVYFLAYAMYASSDNGPLTGPGIADGMRRLLSGAKSFDVDPDLINDVFDELRNVDATFELKSTLGPPSFDAVTGVRTVDGGVFCFKKEGPVTAVRHIDVLRYDRELGEFRGTDFPCFSGFYP